MNPTRADQAFHDFLRQRALDLPAITPAQGVQAMIDFYGEVSAQGCDLEEEGDMLLFQWGCYDWGDGESFEFDVTRQLIWLDGDDEHAIWQLSLTFRFEADAGLRALGDGYRWCGAPSALEPFVEFVTGSSAWKAVADRAGGSAHLAWESVE